MTPQQWQEFDEWLNKITTAALWAIGVVIVILGCWGLGQTQDNWREHDERIGKLRREKGLPTNGWQPIRERKACND